MAERLSREGLERADTRELRRYRQFYVAYPQIREALPPEITTQFAIQIRESATPELALPAQKLLQNLSFTHLAELIKIDDPLKRAFYEIECARGNWSVRELKRQIGSLYYERSGLSNDKKKLSDLAHARAEPATPTLAIRDPYVFEFLGIRSQEVMGEGDSPPVGILLCAEKNQALVKYALAGIDNQLFVSKYQLELPEE